MMTEISLNILDVAQNSVRAEASLIEISVAADTKSDTLKVTIRDNGCGMSEEQLQNVTDPFFTTRTTRKIGLGIPF
ncbi:MAG: ATP-binding protein, partial [Oscillospiraceae bacterium]